MATPHTHTSWVVKRDRETEFIEHWSEWPDWSRYVGLAARAMLLRDCDNPERFVGFGPPGTGREAPRGRRSLRTANARGRGQVLSASLKLLNSRGILRSGGRENRCERSTG
jgi:hypothetical protein